MRRFACLFAIVAGGMAAAAQGGAPGAASADRREPPVAAEPTELDKFLAADNEGRGVSIAVSRWGHGKARASRQAMP